MGCSGCTWWREGLDILLNENSVTFPEQLQIELLRVVVIIDCDLLMLKRRFWGEDLAVLMEGEERMVRASIF